jgi:hypothetical protein
MNKIYKKGTDKVLSMYWFVVITIIAGGVLAMAYIYYGAPYDIRETEVNLFAEKISDCISMNGVIDSGFFFEGELSSEIGNKFIDKCNLNFNVEEDYVDNSEGQYFYEVEIYNVSNTKSPASVFYNGNLNLKGDCFIKKENGKDYSKLAKCTEERFYSLGENGKQYLIKILSVIDKSEKNVKA